MAWGAGAPVGRERGGSRCDGDRHAVVAGLAVGNRGSDAEGEGGRDEGREAGASQGVVPKRLQARRREFDTSSSTRRRATEPDRARRLRHRAAREAVRVSSPAAFDDRESGAQPRIRPLPMLTLLFDGVAYGMLLFVLAVGLAVTLGLMNFINLAHGAFAMAGGYIAVLLMNRLGVPFLACLPIAFVGTALLGALLERTLYRPMYSHPHLDQVLFSIGLVFMAVTAVDYFVGSMQQNITLPAWLEGRLPIEAVGIGKYRLFIIVLCALLTLALQWVLSRTRFGSRLRASVDDPRVAGGLGLDVNRIFLLTFAVGSGLAGLGGALGAEVLGLDPGFPLKFMIYFLIVVSVGGTTTITGPLLAALLLGIADVAGKYYVPKLGAFIVYSLMIVILMLRPQGLFARAGGR
jgi:branched-chain amino acid transport system permease protein